jgi:protein tyrosine phosphatase (PTP) superfamily phosphohydrolase (DUF442 family)
MHWFPCLPLQRFQPVLFALWLVPFAMVRWLWVWLACGVWISTLGCARSHDAAGVNTPDQAPRTAAQTGAPVPPSHATDPAASVDSGEESARFTRLPPGDDLPGLSQVIRIGTRLYSGGEPHGEDAFRSLAKLGVTCVVSVDGSKPQVELARRFGLRYVHIPIGYDGIPADKAAAIAAVMRTVPGTVYIHCHHGRHRGPAAAAIAAITVGDADCSSARKLLEMAGTGAEYAGLWRDVSTFEPPAADEPLPPLVEIATVDSLTEAMAAIDRLWDHLKAFRAADWQPLAGHADLEPVHDAVLLHEALREALRHLEPGLPPDFREQLGAAAMTAEALMAALRKHERETANRHMDQLDAACKACHRQYRQ